MIITIRDTKPQLVSEKAVFLPEQKILVVADLHLGKLNHFRRKGIFVPTSEVNEDLMLLNVLIEKHKPEELIFLGDLFHSEMNSAHQSLMNLIDMYPEIKFTLTKGNHDIIPDEFFQRSYQSVRVEITKERILENGIVLRHELPKLAKEDCFYIIGHVHPGYLIRGRGRQTFRLPCFHLSQNVFTLPAFGKHTGLFIVNLRDEDQSYVILNENVVQVK